MQEEDDAEIDRRPRRVEDGDDAGAGQEAADGFEIAERFACRAVAALEPGAER